MNTKTRTATELADHLLGMLDTEDDDNIRADLIEDLLVLNDRDPSLAPRLRAEGIPA